MERVLRVQTVKLDGPGFSSISPERRRKVEKNYTCYVVFYVCALWCFVLLLVLNKLVKATNTTTPR